MSLYISADGIYERIPHSGAMRLLDCVVSWDDTSIECWATSHTDPSNPLRENGILAGLHALEYAAQAVAVHGSLMMPDRRQDKPELVYVATFRGVEMRPGALDQIAGPTLTITASLVAALSNGWSYEFSVASQAVVLARGKTAVVAPGVST